MSRTKRALSGAVILVVQGILAAATPFVVSPILLKLDGRETLGQFSIVVQVVSYVLLIDLGVTQALARELAQLSYREEKKVDRDRAIVTGVAFLAGIGVVASASLALIAASLHFWMKDSESSIGHVRTALLIYAAWMPLRFPLTIASTLIYSSQLVAQYAVIATIADIIRSIGMICAVATGLGLPGIALTTVAAEGFAALISLYVGRAILRDIVWRTRPSLATAGRLTAVGIPLGLMSLADRLTFYSQSIVVGAMFDSAAAAAFYASRAPGNSGLTLIWRSLDSIVPGLNDLFSRGTSSEFRSVFVRLAGYAIGGALWFGAMLWLLNETIVRLWLGRDFYLGWVMTASLALLAPISTFKNISTKFLVVQGSGVRTYMLVILAEGLLNLALSFGLASVFGSPGVMVAIIGAHSISMIYLYRQAISMTGTTAMKLAIELGKRVARCAAPGVLAGTACVLVIGATNMRQLAAVVAISGVVGAGGLLFFGFDPVDRATVIRLLQRSSRAAPGEA